MTDLLAHGYAELPRLLDPADAHEIRALWDADGRHRSHVVMQRHNFGRGDYKYFANPLPAPVAVLRETWYAKLAPIANVWNERLALPARYPETLAAFLETCAAHGQQRPTPLILRYGPGDFNCLHTDTYGEVAFPFQMTVFLSGRDEYDGGEFVLVEQRPRAQSRPIVFRPEIGDALIFPNTFRPVSTARGFSRTTFRHGVSEIRSGERFALGIIFHNAR